MSDEKKRYHFERPPILFPIKTRYSYLVNDLITDASVVTISLNDGMFRKQGLIQPDRRWTRRRAQHLISSSLLDDQPDYCHSYYYLTQRPNKASHLGSRGRRRGSIPRFGYQRQMLMRVLSVVEISSGDIWVGSVNIENWLSSQGMNECWMDGRTMIRWRREYMIRL